MLDAGMRFHDNIDPNWATEECKMKGNDNHLFISIHLEIQKKKKKKEKKRDYVRKSAHEVISSSNHPP